MRLPTVSLLALGRRLGPGFVTHDRGRGNVGATHDPSTHRAPSHRLGFFRGLVIALPIGLLLWAAILGVAWWLWRG